jgi:hypothetical protein
MIILVGLILVLALAAPAQAQTYSRCVDAAGKVYLTDGTPPTGVRCVAQVTKEIKDTPHPAEKLAAPMAGQHSLWLTEPSGVILMRTYPTEEACRAARDVRVTSATQPTLPDIAFRCLPAGSKP